MKFIVTCGITTRVTTSDDWNSGTFLSTGFYYNNTVLNCPPYISIVNSTCANLWPTETNKASIGPLPRSTPLLGSTFNTIVSLQALSASSWKSHFGVNTHAAQ
jgi:hypothetical protein